MKILLVEDDEGLASFIVDKLKEQKQYLVDWSNNGLEGLEWAETYEYDLILLDVVLPQLGGINICQKLREKGDRTPILLLTARDNISQKVTGLDAGADDYLVKPFDHRELLARIRALSRRNNDVLHSVLEWEELTLDPNNCQVQYQKQPLKLTAKEYSLLELFLRHPQRIFDRDTIVEKVWSWAECPSDNAVRTQIKSLRHKLKEAGLNSELIETVYGMGYRLKEAPTTTEPRIDEGLNAIWHKYQNQYRDRIAVLQRAAAAIAKQNLDPELQQQALNTAHTLVGSLGSFGKSEGSQICRHIENLLQSPNLEYKNYRQLEQSINELLECLDLGSAEFTDTEEAIVHEGEANLNPHYKLLIVDDDFPLAQALVSEAVTWGIEAEVAESVDQARKAIAYTHPDAVLLDLSFPEDRDGGLGLLQELNDQKTDISVIAFTARESFADRLEVARLGGKGFLTKPVSPSNAIETVASLLEQNQFPQATILSIDSDLQRGKTISKLLQAWQWEVVAVNSLDLFWDTLETSNPDLILTELEVDSVSAMEITQTVRHDPRWSHLPIIAVGKTHPEENPLLLQQICAVGIDDYLSFPLDSQELLARILNRLDKERLRRYLAETDPLTGIANRRASLKQLQRLSRLAKRQQQPWCFVAIDIDNFKQINDRYGHDGGDRVLRRLGQLLKQEFRQEDAIARWGGEEFILGLYDMSKKAAIARLEDFLDLFHQQEFSDTAEGSFQVTFSAGIAQFPLDGQSLDTLYQYADAALYRAKAAGKNCIV